jgi:hypothetical protein
VAHRFLGERDRGEVVELAVVAAPAQVFAVVGDAVGIEKLPEIADEAFVQR